MSGTKLIGWWRGLNVWERLAVALWSSILLGVSVRVLIAPHSRTVYPIFSESARQWWIGGPMYPPDRPPELQGGFRYSPAFAVLMSPFALLPEDVGGVLWRLFITGTFLGTLAWWLRAALPRPLTRTQTALIFLLVAPLSITSVNNGQANVLVIAMLLAAVAGARAERWNLVTLCMGVAFLLKVYPLAIGLLLVVIYPRQLALRMVLAVAVTVGFPFLLQRPDYVAHQYHDWIECVRVDDRSQTPLSIGYRDAWLLVRLFEVPLSRPLYELLQLVAAAGLAGLCLAMKWRRWPTRHLLTALLALGVCWMMLLGPATESCTYILLAPTLAWAVLESWLRPRSWTVRALLLAACALFMSSHIASWFPWVLQWHALGVHPLGALLLLVCLLVEQVRAPRPTILADPVQTAWPQARAA